MSNRLIIVSPGNGLTLLRNEYNEGLRSDRPVHEANFDMSTPEAPSSEQLETFANQYTGRDYTIDIHCPEFTSLCPKTGQPDFGNIMFSYTPAERCVELKSLKLYLQRFRNEGVFYEHLINRLLDDFVAACQPKWCRVIGVFTPRGGITTTVTCTYGKMMGVGEPD